jgi:hypothetical protein
MVTRDVNHPHILFWDNGNEGGFKLTLGALFSIRPQRRRVLHPWTPFNGVNTSHYLAYDIAAIACTHTIIATARSWPTPTTGQIHLYAHRVPARAVRRQRRAGLEECWTLMQRSKYLGGAFIWALVDEGLKRPTRARLTASNQAPDGIVGPTASEAAFTRSRLWSPIQVAQHEWPAQG